MNTVDARVTEILEGGPWPAFGKWWVTVQINCWGREVVHDMMFGTLEEARSVKVGDMVRV